ncbi:MAG: STAS domain-containing protein [Armatimonadetes bacterium]|nr:STAS domain-containing protein [Armatimonadota bacterium]
MDDQFNVREFDGRVALVTLPPTLTQESAAELRKVVNGQIDAGRLELLVVCDKLTRVDSKVLSCLNQAAFRLSTVQGQLHIVSPSPAVYDQLKAAGSIGSVEFHMSEKMALEVVGIKADEVSS